MNFYHKLMFKGEMEQRWGRGFDQQETTSFQNHFGFQNSKFSVALGNFFNHCWRMIEG
jgi:hypothetical protein